MNKITLKSATSLPVAKGIDNPESLLLQLSLNTEFIPDQATFEATISPAFGPWAYKQHVNKENSYRKPKKFKHLKAIEKSKPWSSLLRNGNTENVCHTENKSIKRCSTRNVSREHCYASSEMIHAYATLISNVRSSEDFSSLQQPYCEPLSHQTVMNEITNVEQDEKIPTKAKRKVLIAVDSSATIFPRTQSSTLTETNSRAEPGDAEYYKIRTKLMHVLQKEAVFPLYRKSPDIKHLQPMMRAFKLKKKRSQQASLSHQQSFSVVPDKLEKEYKVPKLSTNLIKDGINPNLRTFYERFENMVKNDRAKRFF